MRKRRGNLNGELEYVRAGLAAPWSPAELERMRLQAISPLGPANPEVADPSTGAELDVGAASPAMAEPRSRFESAG
jgi:hypothetical protein